jgi:hypothetical protein
VFGHHPLAHVEPGLNPLLTQWGALGDANSQFRRPTWVAAGPNGNIYVVDTGNDRIQRFTPTLSPRLGSTTGGAALEAGLPCTSAVTRCRDATPSSATARLSTPPDVVDGSAGAVVVRLVLVDSFGEAGRLAALRIGAGCGKGLRPLRRPGSPDEPSPTADRCSCLTAPPDPIGPQRQWNPRRAPHSRSFGAWQDDPQAVPRRESS